MQTLSLSSHQDKPCLELLSSCSQKDFVLYLHWLELKREASEEQNTWIHLAEISLWRHVPSNDQLNVWYCSCQHHLPNQSNFFWYCWYHDYFSLQIASMPCWLSLRSGCNKKTSLKSLLSIGGIMANQIICGVHTSLFHTTKSLHLRLHPPVKSSELCNNLFSVYIRKIIGIIGHFLIIQGDIAKLKKIYRKYRDTWSPAKMLRYLRFSASSSTTKNEPQSADKEKKKKRQCLGPGYDKQLTKKGY